MQVWELDFADVITAHSDQTHKKQHQVEAFQVVDAGTSILIDTLIRDDFQAETVIASLTEVFTSAGLPQIIRFDRDPRFIASWSMDKFPSAFMRFLLCLEITIDVCPPRRPDLKPYVERFIRSFKEECVYKVKPTTVLHAQQAANDYSIFYNLERPNQAVTCRNQPPALAIGHPPYLPRLPLMVNPDAWLNLYHNHSFRRQVRSNGSVSVDKSSYYVGKKYKGQRVLLRLKADTQQFDIYLGDTCIKQVDIKGLYQGDMEFADYFEYIKVEARSEAQRLKLRRRKRARQAS